jgi:hypothetical protein
MPRNSFLIQKSFFTLLFLAFLAPNVTLAQESIKINKISGQVTFDGRPDEEAWNEASVFPMIVHSPNFGTEPTEKSEIMVGYTQEYLWVGASWIPMTTMKMPWHFSPCHREQESTIPFPMTEKVEAAVA